MNHKTICILLAFLVAGIASNLSAQGTAFMYQGHVDTNGAPANGPFDFQFTLFDNPTNGNLVSGPETNYQVTVTSGLFNTTIDFGPVFTGSNYWLSIGVRTNNGPLSTNTFTVLTPRQPLLPVPYAIFATSASNLLGTLSATQLSGALPSAQITGTYSGTVNFTNATNSFTGTFYGNGVNLTNLNGSQITSGTVPDSALATNVAFLNSNQLYSGANSFTNRNNSFTGSFFGNGLVGWVPVYGSFTNAVADTGYILLNSNTTTVMLPPTNSLLLGDVIRVSCTGSGGWTLAGYPAETVVGNFYSYRGSGWLQASIPAAGSWACMASASGGVPMYAAGVIGSGGAYESEDYGATWSPLGLTGTSWGSLACSDSGQIIYIGGNKGTGGSSVECSTNWGASWFTIFGTGNWSAIGCSSDGSTIIAANTNSTATSCAVYVSSNFGASSNKVSTISGITSCTAVTCSSDGTRMAAAFNGGSIYYGVNGSWTSASKTAAWNAMAGSANGLHLVASAITNMVGGSIFLSTNGGANWSQTTATNAYWNCLTTSADGNRIVGGINSGPLWGSANFGSTWTMLNATNAFWSCLTCSADGNKLAGGASVTSGEIYYSTIGQQFISSTYTNSPIVGGQGTAVELQYIGNNQFMPVSSSGTIWAN